MTPAIDPSALALAEESITIQNMNRVESPSTKPTLENPIKKKARVEKGAICRSTSLLLFNKRFSHLNQLYLFIPLFRYSRYKSRRHSRAGIHHTRSHSTYNPHGCLRSRPGSDFVVPSQSEYQRPRHLYRSSFCSKECYRRALWKLLHLHGFGGRCRYVKHAKRGHCVALGFCRRFLSY